MQGYFALILHAHLPFVRHPEHERFLEENWLFEAITETYVPLLRSMQGWHRDGMDTRMALTLTPTLCSMLQDRLLQERYIRRLEQLIELSEKEVHRTYWDKPLHDLALFYQKRFVEIRDTYAACGGDLVGAFAEFQNLGKLEIVASAATHALLPLLAGHPPSVRAQIRIGCDSYRRCFGCDPRGIWLPECAYVEGLEAVLQEANVRWFVTDSHGILYARPRPIYGIYAPIFAPNGVAVFGRDLESARQVWSRNEGYPGDPSYRDFYRDIGFDLDFDYVRSYLPAPDQRGFTGMKYYRITGLSAEKQVYDRTRALQVAANHAQNFMEARIQQIEAASVVLDRPPLIVSPYDAELFGHWWYEGSEFVDYFMRKAYYDQKVFRAVTPGEYLRAHPTNQLASPSASSWGEEGYWRVWLNESNEWILPHLQVAQERMTEMVSRFNSPDSLQARALKQAGRELLLAQASDWPFILRTGTSPEYARNRVKVHLLRFTELHDQLTTGKLDEAAVAAMESQDNIFPEINYGYWKG